jgi:hypothetical protein
VIVALQNLMSQAVSIFSIILAILTGTGNIYSAPEFAFGGGNNWLHLGAHLLIGTTIGSLVPWVVGSAILFATKKLTGSGRTIKSAA